VNDTRLEIRQQVDGGLTLTGYAAVTEQPYEHQWYVETVARGAFRRSLNQAPNGPDVVLTVNHGHAGSGLPIARTTAGTLRLSEDQRGLLVHADLDPEDPEVQSLHRKMQRGDLDGQMSFGFRTTEQSWSEDRTKRRILQADIHRGDVSVVNFGASPTTSSSIRAAGTGAGVSFEVRRRRAETIGTRFAGIGTVGFSGHGLPPSVKPLPDHARQQLELLRLSERGSTPPRGPRRVVRLPDYTARARQELDILKTRKR
jgi:hypothetical protein